MASDMAHCVNDFFESDETREYLFPINNLRNKLENNQYERADDFIHDVNRVFEKSAKAIGGETEISLAIQTLLREFLIKARSLNTFDAADFEARLSAFSEKFNSVLPIFPDSLEEFQNLIDRTETKPLLEEYHTKFTERSFDKREINVNSLHNALRRLSNDEDVTTATDIITKYEFIIPPNDSELLEIDMTKLQPYTIKMLQKFIDDIRKKKN